VVWSGLFNLLCVLASSGAVAFGIVSLLPVELVLQVGSSAGFAMVSALLVPSEMASQLTLACQPATSLRAASLIASICTGCSGTSLQHFGFDRRRDKDVPRQCDSPQ
jgi:phosphate/sulfate permease